MSNIFVLGGEHKKERDAIGCIKDYICCDLMEVSKSLVDNGPVSKLGEETDSKEDSEPKKSKKKNKNKNEKVWNIQILTFIFD